MNCCLVDIAIVDAFGRGPCCCCFFGFVLKGIRIQFVVCLVVAVLADVAAGGMHVDVASLAFAVDCLRLGARARQQFALCCRPPACVSAANGRQFV